MDAICYGFRSFGQLNEDPFRPILQQVQPLRNERSLTSAIQFVTFAWSRCYIIMDDNSLVVRGFVDSSNAFGKQIHLPFDDELKEVLCLRDYDVFLTEQGDCWKYAKNCDFSLMTELYRDKNKKSKQGKIIHILTNGNEMRFILFDSGLLSDPYGSTIIFPRIKIKKVSCGFEHNICLSDNGSVYTWGCSSRGQLGNGSLLTSEHPELLELLDGLYVSDISAGGWHSVAVTACGALYSWGWNNSGQLGFRNDKSTGLNNDDVGESVSILPEPTLVEWPNNKEVLVKQVACGDMHTAVLSDDGQVWGCGSNKYGQLNPHSKEEFFDEMIRVPVPENVAAILEVSCVCWNTILYVSH